VAEQAQTSNRKIDAYGAKSAYFCKMPEEVRERIVDGLVEYPQTDALRPIDSESRVFGFFHLFSFDHFEHFVRNNIDLRASKIQDDILHIVAAIFEFGEKMMIDKVDFIQLGFGEYGVVRIVNRNRIPEERGLQNITGRSIHVKIESVREKIKEWEVRKRSLKCCFGGWLFG